MCSIMSHIRLVSQVRSTKIGATKESSQRCQRYQRRESQGGVRQAQLEHVYVGVQGFRWIKMNKLSH